MKYVFLYYFVLFHIAVNLVWFRLRLFLLIVTNRRTNMKKNEEGN